MMLRLSGPLRWEFADGTAQPLPVVLPVAILLVLAQSRQWTSREMLAALFWPEQPGDAAALNLRVNLHKARRLLRDFRISAPLETERRRVRWSPPTDLEQLPGGGVPIAAGFSLRAFESFESWLRQWRASCAVPTPRAERFESGAADAALEAEAPAPGWFYGRRIELARLRASTARTTIVTGEAGIGKSRLVAEAYPGARWLHCREGLQQASFGAVAELFQNHPDWLNGLGAYRLDVARLLPEVAPDEPLPPLDALTARLRLFEALARIIEQQAPLLAVDDLQWADAATLEWLLLLCRRGRIRWIATARGAEVPVPVRSVLRALEQKGEATVLDLQGLDRPAINALLHERRPDLALAQTRPGPHPWLDAICGYTSGNPFCAIEVMSALGRHDHPEQLARIALPERVAMMIRQRRDRLPDHARAMVDAASLAVGQPALAQLASMANLDITAAIEALEVAQRHGLLQGTACRHDLVRQAVQSSLSPQRAADLHARAAHYLARSDADPEVIALHWRRAKEDEAAWPWVLRSAQRLRQRGERSTAAQALAELRSSTRDPTLALRAEIMLTQDRLFDDLAAGREGLETTLVRAAGLPPGIARQSIEAHALAGLVDNAVFSGELDRAIGLAHQLHEKLPGLPPDVLIEAHQTLIEATMRQGDFDAALSSLHALRAAGAADAVVLSFEAQILWFSGAVRDARRVFEELLARHPDYCSGLTIENDLAVMCHALGDLDAAGTMARRSLQSWAGVPHTEAISLLVLGSVLTSLGRFSEASQALASAEELGRQQCSRLFASEALVRRARLHWCAGDALAARQAALAACEQAGPVCEPLRGSNLALMEILTAVAAGEVPDHEALATFERYRTSSRHPLVHARYWRSQVAMAEQRNDPDAALQAAHRQLAVAQAAGLFEWECEAHALAARIASAATSGAAAAGSPGRAHGFAWLHARAQPKFACARAAA